MRAWRCKRRKACLFGFRRYSRGNGAEPSAPLTFWLRRRSAIGKVCAVSCRVPCTNTRADCRAGLCHGRGSPRPPTHPRIAQRQDYCAAAFVGHLLHGAEPQQRRRLPEACEHFWYAGDVRSHLRARPHASLLSRCLAHQRYARCGVQRGRCESGTEARTGRESKNLVRRRRRPLTAQPVTARWLMARCDRNGPRCDSHPGR
jgi:hypothetical protein